MFLAIIALQIFIEALPAEDLRKPNPHAWTTSLSLGLRPYLPRGCQDQEASFAYHELEGLCLGIGGRVQQECGEGLGLEGKRSNCVHLKWFQIFT